MNRRTFLSSMAMGGTGLVSMSACAHIPSRSGNEPWRDVLTDHFDGQRFSNPEGPTGNSFKNFLRWRRTRTPEPWPEWVENAAQPDFPLRASPRQTFVTFINHCTFLIQLPGLTLLTDPIYSERASPVGFAGPKRIRSPGVDWEDLPDIDAVLVSHAHYDHLDVPTLQRLNERFSPKFITGLGNKSLLYRHGIRNIDELDWWKTLSMAGTEITFTPARHWSARSLFDRNTTLWGGFAIRHAHKSLFFAGDCGYGPEFVTIRERIGPPDLAFLPIGAYEPRWFMRYSHLAPDEAVQAHLDLQAGQSLAMHHDTFPLADEGFGQAEIELAEALGKSRAGHDSFRVPLTGETLAWS